MEGGAKGRGGAAMEGGAKGRARGRLPGGGRGARGKGRRWARVWGEKKGAPPWPATKWASWAAGPGPG